MALPSRRKRSRNLVASAYKVGDRDSDYERRRQLPWQQQSLEVVGLVPELSYASRFYSRMLKQLRVYPATLNAQEQLSEIKVGLPVELLNRVRDPSGGKSQLLQSYGRLMFITGEGLLFGRELDGYWRDVGSFSDYRRAQRDALEGKLRMELPAVFRDNSMLALFTLLTVAVMMLAELLVGVLGRSEFTVPLALAPLVVA